MAAPTQGDWAPIQQHYNSGFLLDDRSLEDSLCLRQHYRQGFPRVSASRQVAEFLVYLDEDFPKHVPDGERALEYSPFRKDPDNRHDDTDDTLQVIQICESPERGVSPAKSAMKHSPGSSLRGTSPMNLGASPASKAMSDTSDTPSVDGSGKKKKKSVRVSFTDQDPNAEQPVTPEFRAAAARKVSPLIDDDMEEIMKPRPDLPSFFSVRPSRVQQEVA